MGYISPNGMPKVPNLKFLEKVDLNGPEMHMLFRFLKRNTPKLFVPRYGMAAHLYEHHSKFLCNRYGQVKHYYPPSTRDQTNPTEIDSVRSIGPNEWNSGP